MERRIFSPDQHDRDSLELSSNKLAAIGIPFDSIPEHVYGGMPYITPGKLVRSGITAYSQRYILTLIRNGEIPSFHLANRVVLDARGVQRLLDREQASREAGEHAGGRKPGPRGQGIREDESEQTD